MRNTNRRRASGAEHMRNIGFVAGVAILLFNGVLETLSHYGYHSGPCPVAREGAGLPVAMLLTCALLIAPYTVGVTVAGRVWAAVPNLLMKVPGIRLTPSDPQHPPGGQAEEWADGRAPDDDGKL